MNNDEKRGFDIIKKFCDETPLSPKEFAFAENQGLIASGGVGYSLTKYGRDLLHGKVGDQAMNNENFESAVGVTGTEFAKRQFVAKFANGTNMSHEEIKFGQNHGLIFVNGGGWSLTEYGRNYLPERGTAPAIAMFSDDSDHTQCPDDDSYLPQPGHPYPGVGAQAGQGKRLGACHQQDQSFATLSKERVMNEIFEEAQKRNVVHRFCDGRTLTQEEITFCQNHGLIFVNGDADWSLTEYGLHYLPASPDGDSSQCPDDDSYLSSSVSIRAALNLDPPIPSAPSAEDRGVLDVQVGGDHYKKMGHHQPWEVLATWMTPEELRGYMKGTVIAYLARERDKGGDLDIEKVQHTIELWQQVRKDKQCD